MDTPVTSEGSRSGVNWMRCSRPSMDAARARASMVLPTPGTSSMSRCPSANRQVRASSTTSRLPRITRSTLFAISLNRTAKKWSGLTWPYCAGWDIASFRGLVAELSVAGPDAAGLDARAGDVPGCPPAGDRRGDPVRGAGRPRAAGRVRPPAARVDALDGHLLGAARREFLDAVGAVLVGVLG